MASRSIVSFVAAAAGILAASATQAHQEAQTQEVLAQQQQPPEPYGPPPIPPNAEGQAVTGTAGAYCYGGPHPVDTRVAGGNAWDEADGRHTHFYPPFDLRLFTLRDGCYYFIGDPTDFGYRGQTYSYYGAHPIHDHYGGNWCFMIGGHSHFWQPWSSHFVTVGPWFYWHGPYDPFFWSYWPYYSFYYRSYYPHYYGGGRFYRGRDRHVAPAIGRVPAPRGWTGGAGPSWRGTPPTGMAAGGAAPSMGRSSLDGSGQQSWRGVPVSPSTGSWSGRSSGVAVPAPQGHGRGGWSGTPPAAGGPAPRSSISGWGPSVIGSPSRGGGSSVSGPRMVPPSSPRMAPPSSGGSGSFGPRGQGNSGWRK